MGIYQRREAVSGSGPGKYPGRQVPRSLPGAKKKVAPPETPGLFAKRGAITRQELKRYLWKQGPRYMPGTRKRMSYSKRIEMEKAFGKEFGNYITKREYQKRLRQLVKDKRRTHAPSEMKALRRQIKYLKEIGGI